MVSYHILVSKSFRFPYDSDTNLYLSVTGLMRRVSVVFTADRNFPFTGAGFSCRIASETGEEAVPISGYILHLPEDEGVALSGPAVRRLLEAGDGDAALLYIAVVQNRGAMDGEKVRARLKWDGARFRRALEALAGLELVGLPGPAAPPEPEEKPAEYTRADLARALEGGEFAALTGAVEEKLGKRLTTPDLAALLGLYDQLGLPADVIFLLVGFCAERTAARFGPGRRPTVRQIEREGYPWARLGLMDQESAAAYIRDSQRRRENIPRLMGLLGLGDRKPGPSEERYLAEWSGMGFEDEALELAYDKTILKCKELKWAYMHKILSSWHQKGLHTLAQVREGDRPASPRQQRQKRPQDNGAPLADMARMERYRRQLNETKEGQ